MTAYDGDGDSGCHRDNVIEEGRSLVYAQSSFVHGVKQPWLTSIADDNSNNTLHRQQVEVEALSHASSTEQGLRAHKTLLLCIRIKVHFSGYRSSHGSIIENDNVYKLEFTVDGGVHLCSREHKSTIGRPMVR